MIFSSRKGSSGGELFCWERMPSGMLACRSHGYRRGFTFIFFYIHAILIHTIASIFDKEISYEICF